MSTSAPLRECKRPGCGESFVPKPSHKQFHDENCKKAYSKEKKKTGDPLDALRRALKHLGDEERGVDKRPNGSPRECHCFGAPLLASDKRGTSIALSAGGRSTGESLTMLRSQGGRIRVTATPFRWWQHEDLCTHKTTQRERRTRHLRRSPHWKSRIRWSRSYGGVRGCSPVDQKRDVGQPSHLA